MKVFSIKHSMPAGDLLGLLPGIREVCRANNSKCLIYQRVDLAYGEMSGAYLGATYSIRNDNGDAVTMNRAVFEALKPLLIYQDYIEDFIEWNGESTTFDMDALRNQDTTMPYGSLNRWPVYIWPDMACDLSERWLNATPVKDMAALSMSGKILVNRTERYNNMLISYNFLKYYSDKVLFVGLPHEHEIFCQQHKIDIPRFEASNFFEIAVGLKVCKLYIGSQSSIFQVAEGLKIPRILEVCKQMPNVIGSGKGFYDFLYQSHLEYYVNKLFNE